MRTFNSIEDYKPHAKIKDIIALGAKESKHDTHRIISLDPLISIPFKSRSRIRLNSFARNKIIDVLSREEFNNLEILF